MKKLLYVQLAATLSLSLISCASSPPKTSETPVESQPLSADERAIEQALAAVVIGEGTEVSARLVDYEPGGPPEVLIRERCAPGDCRFDEAMIDGAPIDLRTRFQIVSLSGGEPRLVATPILATHHAELRAYSVGPDEPSHLRVTDSQSEVYERNPKLRVRDLRAEGETWVDGKRSPCGDESYVDLDGYVFLDLDDDGSDEMLEFRNDLTRSPFNAPDLREPLAVQAICGWGNEERDYGWGDASQNMAVPAEVLQAEADRAATAHDLAAVASFAALLRQPVRLTDAQRQRLMDAFERSDQPDALLVSAANFEVTIPQGTSRFFVESPPCTQEGCQRERTDRVRFTYHPQDAFRSMILAHALSAKPHEAVASWSAEVASTAKNPVAAHVMTQLSQMTTPPEVRAERAAEIARVQLAVLARADAIEPAKVDPAQPNFSRAKRANVRLQALFVDSVEFRSSWPPMIDEVYWSAEPVFAVFLKSIDDQLDRVVALIDQPMFARAFVSILIARDSEEIPGSLADVVLEKLVHDPAFINDQRTKTFLNAELEKARTVEGMQTLVWGCEPNGLVTCDRALEAFQRVVTRTDATDEAIGAGLAITVGRNWYVLDDAQRSWWIAAFEPGDESDELGRQISGHASRWRIGPDERVRLLVDFAPRAANPRIRLGVLYAASRLIRAKPAPPEMIELLRELAGNEDDAIRSRSERILEQLQD